MAHIVRASCLALPEAEIYRFGCNELTDYILETKKSIERIEIQLDERKPLLLKQAMEFDYNKKEELQIYMKMLKNMARLNARKKWYEWREKLVNSLYNTSAEYKSQLLKVD
jgi:hypothetical protein